ncbi:FHA domain containing protein [hydrothermal vent metagenome]|uniref:FHA domain containing protein n=1 Tax=hydrothermal vent metagenome TaxID=652676 RepID=A0A3B0ZD15_9ZZZZ
MARLILTHEGAVMREYQLNGDRTSVGRKPQNDIHLEDPTVSGEHAVFLKLQHFYVEDLGSTNGVILNGKRVTKRQLNTGDIIRIGRHEFKFIDEVDQFDKTVLINPARLAAKPADLPKKGLVKVLNGPKAGEQIMLNKPYTTLGSPGVQVAVIAKRGNNFFLMPMSGMGDSTKPPELNSQPIGAQSKPLKSGDVIEVAGTKLQFNEA